MKLTKRSVDALRPTTENHFVWDDELPGFGVRIAPSGRKTYVVQYRSGGRTRRITLAKHGVLTADEARKRAREVFGSVAAGENPAEAISVQRRTPSIATLCERFLEEHVAQRCKARTQEEYERVIKFYVKPRFGTHRITDITRADIAKFHHEKRDTPYMANRILSVMSKMFNLAELWGLRPDGTNPCRLVPKYRETLRERFLKPHEMRRLGEVLDEAESASTESKYAIAAFRLLMLTGCRLTEIQTLKWEHVRDGYLHLPDAKTGARRVPLTAAAQTVLKSIEKQPGNPYVIVGLVPGAHLTDLQHPWQRIRAKADLRDVRIHDLRHTFASVAVMSGMSLPMVGKLLGHTQVQTTARYAHLADDPVREAASQVSDEISKALQLSKSAAPQLTVIQGAKSSA